MVQHVMVSVYPVKERPNYTDRLHEAMRHAGLDPALPGSVHALADALGFSYQAAKKAIDGLTKMLTADNNVTAAKFLGVDSEWLATGLGHLNGPKRLSDLAERIARAFDERVPPAMREPTYAQMLNAIMFAEAVGRTVSPSLDPTELPRLDQKTPPARPR